VGGGSSRVLFMSAIENVHALPELLVPATRPAHDRHSTPGVHRRGQVVPLHQRPAIAHGGLSGRALINGQRQVQAIDTHQASCWVDATAVWTDGETSRPTQLTPIGLASASTWDQALITGISDRIGWEAATAWEDGLDLPAAPFLEHKASSRLVLLDGRLGHQLPTVVAVSETSVRWGAGATWDAALGRALYGTGWPTDKSELALIDCILAGAHLGIAAVDIGSALLNVNHLSRLSVQLTAR
jgi:hypothetical protein